MIITQRSARYGTSCGAGHVFRTSASEWMSAWSFCSMWFLTNESHYPFISQRGPGGEAYLWAGHILNQSVTRSKNQNEQHGWAMKDNKKNAASIITQCEPKQQYGMKWRGEFWALWERRLQGKVYDLGTRPFSSCFFTSSHMPALSLHFKSWSVSPQKMMKF